MKRYLFRLLTISLSIVALALFAGSALAQGNGNGGGGGGNGNGGGGGGNGGGGGEDPPPEIGVGFRAYWPVLPTEFSGSLWPRSFAFKTDAAGVPDVALVVGYYGRIDRPGDWAFVYDHLGLIDPDSTYADSDPESPLYDPNTDNLPIEKKFWDLRELVGEFPEWVPDGYTKSRIYGVNTNGRICGSVWGAFETNEPRAMGFYIDLTDPVLEMKPLPAFYPTAITSYGTRVNELGHILLVGTTADSLQFQDQAQVSVYFPETCHRIHVRKNQNEPFLFRGKFEHLSFNSELALLGEIPEYGSSLYRLSVKHQINQDDTDANGIGLSYTDLDNGVANFANEDLFLPTAINESSEFGCKTRIFIKRNREEWRVARIGVDELGDTPLEQWTGGDFSNGVQDINNSGDLFYGQGNEIPLDAYYLHEGDPTVSGDEIFINDFFQLVIPESDPNGIFLSNGPNHCLLSDRDSTGFGWIAGQQLNPDGDRVLLLLIPENTP
jgi:hypothetical protein